MQAESLSDSLDGSSDNSGIHPSQPTNVGFQLTPEDIGILEQHLEKFGEAETKTRTKLVQSIMGELYRHCPVNTPFDKVHASKV
jgi:hypothetical protein